MARTSPLVILNSISMANGSPDGGAYSDLKRLWIVVRRRASRLSWVSLMSSSPAATWLEVARIS